MNGTPPRGPQRQLGRGCLIGCGIGCLVALLAVAVAVYLGFRFVDTVLHKFESEGYDRIQGQVIEVTQLVTNRTIFVGQFVRVTGGSERGLAILAQSAELDGTIAGNVRFIGQTLTVRPGARLLRDLDVLAQVVHLYGRVEGQVTGIYQMIHSNAPPHP